MGNSASQIHLENNVFKKDLESLNNVVQALIQDDEKSFKNPSFNFLDEKSCEEYTFVLENSLKNHLKLDLQSAKDSIYMIPVKNTQTTKDNKDFKKLDLCNMIASHYMRILKMLVLIKHVYDLEHYGDNSIAGITWRNIRKQGNLMEISFCNMAQKDYESNNKKTIDFEKLYGLKYFCSNFLTGVNERKMFVHHLKSLLAKVPTDSISKYASCHKTYNTVFNGKCDKKAESEFLKYLEKEPEELDLNFLVQMGNPVLHENMCGQKEKIIIDLNKKSSLKQELLTNYGKLYRNYKKNINEIVDVVFEFVDSNMQLKSIDSITLERIEKRVIKLVSVFYIQTLVDYYTLLDNAKQIPDNIFANAEINVI